MQDWGCESHLWWEGDVREICNICLHGDELGPLGQEPRALSTASTGRTEIEGIIWLIEKVSRDLMKMRWSSGGSGNSRPFSHSDGMNCFQMLQGIRHSHVDNFIFYSKHVGERKCKKVTVFCSLKCKQVTALVEHKVVVKVSLVQRILLLSSGFLKF